MDLIYQHSLSGGRLFQCGAREIPGVDEDSFNINYVDSAIIITALNRADISIIALTASKFQPQLDGPYLDVLHLPFEDKEDLEGWEIAQIAKMVKRAAKKMGQAIERGEHVLSTCRGGINRSSLLTAFIIKYLEPMYSSQEIIDLIRDNRSERCLSNQLFEAIVIHGF